MSTAKDAGPPPGGPERTGGTPPGGSVLRNRNFLLYLFGSLGSEIGSRGTSSIALYHVFLLTDSTAQVGVVGLVEFIALVVLAPLGGAVADRFDRRRLVQISQAMTLTVSALLAAATAAGVVTVWQIYLAVMLHTVAQTFGVAARKALIPGVVERHQLVKAFALANPAREFSWFAGPALGGLLVAFGGPELMYAVDAATCLLLIMTLSMLRIRPIEEPSHRVNLWRSTLAGVSYVRSRPIVWQLLALDFTTMLFSAWRVVLPALAEDVLQVGPAGYGLLNSAVPAGALVGSVVVYRAIDRVRGGRVILGATAIYGLACLGLAQSRMMLTALIAAVVIGMGDAMWSTVQQAAIQVEISDEMRGRVSSLTQIATKGGNSFGQANVGLIAGFIGPVTALSVGGLVPVAAAALVAVFAPRVREYRMPTAPSA